MSHHTDQMRPQRLNSHHRTPVVTLALIGAATLLLILACVGIYAASVASQEMTAGAKMVVNTGATIMVVVLVMIAVATGVLVLRTSITSGLAILRALESWLEAKAKRTQAQRDADMLVVTASFDEQVLVWQRGHWNKAHLPIGNGQPATPIELAAWQQWLLAHTAPKLIESNAPALAAPELWPAHVDLLDLLPRGRGRLDNIILGVHVDGRGQSQVLSAPLWHLVHGAFGGETGTGKSTLAYALAWQVATAPESAHLVLVDPGETTFKTLADSDRLLCPVVADESECLAAIQMLWQEKNRRTELFKPHPTVEDLAAYNELVPTDQALPYVVMLADELPELLENKDIEQALKRLIRVSRKYGIYLFGIGTSWKHTDLDTSIKRQFRTKIHFSASDAASSRVLLDSPAAAELRDVGRAYARLPFSLAPDLVEIQAPYLDKEKAMALVPKGQQPEPLPLPAPVVDEQDELFVSLVEAGESRRQAAYTAYGKEYAGAIVTRGKKALGEL